jgi:hypothetical protein
MPKNKNWRGYDIPEQIETANRVCFMVDIPDKPEYRLAALSQFHELTTWLSWDKTGDDKARRAAIQFIGSIPTFEQCENIVRIDQMEIINNINTNCGGCGCGGGGMLTPPKVTDVPVPYVPIPFVDEGTNYPPEYDSREAYDEAKCKLAGTLVSEFIGTMQEFSTLGGLAVFGYSAFLLAMGTQGFLAGLLAPLIAVGLSVGVSAVLLGTALASLIFIGAGVMGHFLSISIELNKVRDQMTCDVFHASTTDQMRQVFIDATSEAVAFLGLLNLENGGALTNIIYEIVDYITPDELLRAIIKGVSSLPVNEGDYDCTQCVPVGAAFAPLLINDNFSLGNGWSVKSNMLRINASGTGSDGVDRCETRSLCQQAVDLPFKSSPWGDYLHIDFLASAPSMTVLVSRFNYNGFGEDGIIRIRATGLATIIGSFVVTQGEFWVPTTHAYAFTGLTAGESYTLEIAAGNGIMVSSVEEQ